MTRVGFLFLGIGLLVAIIVLLLALLMSNRVYNPIGEMVRTASEEGLPSEAMARQLENTELYSIAQTYQTMVQRLNHINLRKEQEKLAKELSGVMNMGGQPDLLFVVDMPKEDLAIKEAKKLGIPVIAIADTNADPTLVDFPVPGNDDAIRAIQFYCELVSSAVLDGIQAEIAAQGVKVEEIMAENDAKPARKKAAKAATEGEEEAKAGKKAKAAE